MNFSFSPWIAIDISNPFFVLGYVAMSVFLEAFIWLLLFNYRFELNDLLFIGGWTVTIQAISTPVSIGVASLLYGPSLYLFQGSPALFTLLLQSGGQFFNPLGLVIGFLLVPITLEFSIWRNVRNWVQNHTGHSLTQKTYGLTDTLLLGGTIGANLFSFSISILFSCSFFASMVVFSIVTLSTLFLYLIGVLFIDKHYATHFFETEMDTLARGPSSRGEGVSRRSEWRIRRKHSHRVGVIVVALTFGYIGLLFAPLYAGSIMPYGFWQYSDDRSLTAISDRSGRIHAAWIHEEGISYRTIEGSVWYQRFENGWSTPLLLTQQVNTLDYYHEYSSLQLIGDGNNQIAASWKEWNSSWPQWTVHFKLFDGSNWQPSVTIPCNYCEDYSLQFNNVGELFALWLERHQIGAATTWKLYSWMIDSPEPPLLVTSILDNASQFHVSDPHLLSPNDGCLYALWLERCYGWDPIRSSVFHNNSWSEPVNVSQSNFLVESWDATTSANDSIQVVWCGYNSNPDSDEYVIPGIYHRSGSRGVWRTTEFLEEDWVDIEDFSSDQKGNLQILWTPWFRIPPGMYVYPNSLCSKQCIGGVWQATENLLIPEGWNPVLIMGNPAQYHIIQNEKVGITSHFAHYQFDHGVMNTIHRMPTVTWLHYYYLTLSTMRFGLLIISGTLILLPLVVHVLRRCFFRLWDHAQTYSC